LNLSTCKIQIPPSPLIEYDDNTRRFIFCTRRRSQWTH